MVLLQVICKVAEPRRGGYGLDGANRSGATPPVTAETMRQPAAVTRRLLAWLRAQIRSSELWLVAVALLVGTLAGGMATVMGVIAHAVQVALFGIEPEVRLSVAPPIAPIRLLAIPAGGLILGALAFLWSRRRPAPPVDPVEANALRGGRMSLQDSVYVAVQTLISNGFGASVGLEAAYTQMGAAVASRLGVWLTLRRADLRLPPGPRRTRCRRR